MIEFNSMIFREPQPVREVFFEKTRSRIKLRRTVAAATTWETRSPKKGVKRLSCRSPSMKKRPTPYHKTIEQKSLPVVFSVFSGKNMQK